MGGQDEGSLAAPRSGAPGERGAGRAAGFTLAVLTGMNLLNYVDRYLITALLPNIAAELRLSDAAGGLLGTAFILVYALSSPLFGRLGDRGSRPRMLALGVGIWSLATAAAGWAHGLGGLFAARALVGVGEAAYGTVAPALLADTFAPTARGRVMAAFSVAMPVGGALGYLLGGALGARLGWRPTFFVVGLPGLALAALALRLPDPPRGGRDAVQAGPAQAAGAPTGAAAGPPLGGRALVITLWRDRRYRSTVAGFTAYTFALGGMAFWMPTYLMREHHCPQAQGMLMFGGVTVATGIAGTLGGGWLGDWLLARRADAYVHIKALSMLGAALAATAMLQMPTLASLMLTMALAQLMAFLSVGPVNATLVACTPAAGRASAMAVCILCIHLLGDAISPAIIGALSDSLGLGRAMGLVPTVFLLAGALWWTGGRRQPEAS